MVSRNHNLRLSAPTSTAALPARRHFSGHHHQPRDHRHYQRRPTGTYFSRLCSHRSDTPTPSSHYHRQGALFLATTTNSGVIATISADQLGDISMTSAATVPIGLLVQAATNRPRRCRHCRLFRAFCTVYSSDHTVIHPATNAKFTATNTAGIFTSPLLWTTTASMAASTGTVRSTHISRPHPRPTQPRLLQPQCSYRIVREHPTATVSRSELFNTAAQDHSPRFTGPSAVNSAPTASSANTISPRNAEGHSVTTTFRVLSDFSLSSYTIRFQDQPLACLPLIFAERQLPVGVSKDGP